MCRALTTGNHTIVTTYTASNNLCMIHLGRRNGRPGFRPHGMTGLTRVRCIDVCCTLTTGDHTIVTARTRADHCGMINGGRRHRCPGSWKISMTGIASVAAVDMRRALAAGADAVMTGNAVTGKIGVINQSACGPALDVMAAIAFIRRGNVSG